MSDSPSATKSCPKCGNTLPAEASDGLCPQCLQQEALQPSQFDTQLLDENAATLPLSGPRPSLLGTNNIKLPLPAELTALLPKDDYSVESFLGQGGMGAVYKGTQVRLQRPVAIKIMLRDQAKDRGFEERFRREALALAKLNHPNIVSVIDYGEAGPDYLYIVMELIDGVDLVGVIRSGQMTQQLAMKLLPQICDALQFAHDHGIIHRDIKPSNIMLTRDGRVKMCDFGLAKSYDVDSGFRTKAGIGMGTPDYAAPEQFNAAGIVDHRADIYALGVMIYQMITGNLPRGAWKPPSQRPGVVPQWDAIVSHAMEPNPSDRYARADEVKTEVSRIMLVDALEQAPRLPGNSPIGENPALKSKSKTLLIVGSLSAAVVITAGVFSAFDKPSAWFAKPSSAPPPLPASHFSAPPGTIPFILTSANFQWSAPVNLGPKVNSAKDEQGVAITADGLVLIVQSARFRVEDLFECTRRKSDEPFSEARSLDEVNTEGAETNPWISADGLTLLYSSSQGPGHQGGLFLDIYQRQRSDRSSPWGTQTHLGPQVNVSGLDLAPSLSADGLTLMFISDRPGGFGWWDVWRSSRKSMTSPFEKPENLGAGVNSSGTERQVFLASDNRTILFMRNDASSADQSPSVLFMGALDAQGNFRASPLNWPIKGKIATPWLSPDGHTLWFAWDGPGGEGGMDIWQIHRLPKQ